MGPSDCIYARNCEIRRLDRKRAADFLERNHFLGTCQARYFYGLFTRRSSGTKEVQLPEGSLVAVGAFSNGRRFRDGHLSYEWIRYASLKELRVMGGMGKILNEFVKELHPGDVMTYVDASKSDGSSYLELGFQVIEKVERAGFTNLKLKRFYPPEPE